MQIQAIYNQGRIEFDPPIRLKHNNIRLTVTVPDEEVELPANNTSKAQDMIAKYQALLDAPLPSDECLPELSSNYETRLHAIELRNQMRKDQGRPV